MRIKAVTEKTTKTKAKKSPDKTKRGRGRPPVYTDELAAEICRLIGEEAIPLSKICKMPGMPAFITVNRWMNERSDFSNKYARARLQMADTLFDQALEISDNVLAEKGCVAKARLQVDTRKWAVGKLNPQKYADKLLADISVDMRGVPDEELTTQIAGLLGQSAPLIDITPDSQHDNVD